MHRYCSACYLNLRGDSASEMAPHMRNSNDVDLAHRQAKAQSQEGAVGEWGLRRVPYLQFSVARSKLHNAAFGSI